MLKQMFCKECGAEIVLDYTTPSRSFRLNENGVIERDDNNLSDKPSIIFYCSNDREHNIGEGKEFDIWADSIEFEFYERGWHLY
jgi:hypothetical protein